MKKVQIKQTWLPVGKKTWRKGFFSFTIHQIENHQLSMWSQLTLWCRTCCILSSVNSKVKPAVAITILIPLKDVSFMKEKNILTMQHHQQQPPPDLVPLIALGTLAGTQPGMDLYTCGWFCLFSLRRIIFLTSQLLNNCFEFQAFSA